MSSGAVRGALNIGGNTSWQLPIWLQLLFPGLIALLCFLIPESPRWMYVSGKKEKATAMLTRWHGYGDRNSEWVKLELTEYEEYLNFEGSVCDFLERPTFANERIGQAMVGLPRTLQDAYQSLPAPLQRLLLHVRSMGR